LAASGWPAATAEATKELVDCIAAIQKYRDEGAIKSARHVSGDRALGKFTGG
jgi:hypothetical protein